MTKFTNFDDAIANLKKRENLAKFDTSKGIKQNKESYKTQQEYFEDLIKVFCKEEDIPLLEENINLEISSYDITFTLITNDYWIKECSEKMKTFKKFSNCIGCKRSNANIVEVENENEFHFRLNKVEDDLIPTTKAETDSFEIKIFKDGKPDLEVLQGLVGRTIKMIDDNNDNPNYPRRLTIKRIFRNNEEENINFAQAHKIFDPEDLLIEFNAAVSVSGLGVIGVFPQTIINVQRLMGYPIYDEAYRPYYMEFDKEALGFED